jgi:hypothetical protein
MSGDRLAPRSAHLRCRDLLGASLDISRRFWKSFTTAVRRGALECGSLLPLSSPHACLRGLQPESTTCSEDVGARHGVPLL